jgi:hypothetical protein
VFEVQATQVPPEQVFIPLIWEQSPSPEHPVHKFAEHLEAVANVQSVFAVQATQVPPEQTFLPLIWEQSEFVEHVVHTFPLEHLEALADIH